MNFRKQQQAQSLGMNILSCTIPVFELTLSSLRTYRFLFQAFFWTKFRPGCVILASNSIDPVTGEPLFKAYQVMDSKLFKISGPLSARNQKFTHKHTCSYNKVHVWSPNFGQSISVGVSESRIRTHFQSNASDHSIGLWLFWCVFTSLSLLFSLLFT